MEKHCLKTYAIFAVEDHLVWRDEATEEEKQELEGSTRSEWTDEAYKGERGYWTGDLAIIVSSDDSILP